jgi:hypothetical protein
MAEKSIRARITADIVNGQHVLLVTCLLGSLRAG